jgi:hypothetical protein
MSQELDLQELRADYTAMLRENVIALVKASHRRTGEPFREIWHSLYARLSLVAQFDAEDYAAQHKLKSKLDAVIQAGLLIQLHSLAEQLE